MLIKISILKSTDITDCINTHYNSATKAGQLIKYDLVYPTWTKKSRVVANMSADRRNTCVRSLSRRAAEVKIRQGIYLLGRDVGV